MLVALSMSIRTSYSRLILTPPTPSGSVICIYIYITSLHYSIAAAHAQMCDGGEVGGVGGEGHEKAKEANV